MEESSNSTLLDFDSPVEQSSYIKVIGVGGGGGNAVNNMYAQGIKGVDFIICNTDMKALNSSPISNRIVLGTLGAGNIPDVARNAALAHKDEIRGAIENNTQMLFITAGMGGGTGTGAAPVIAEIAKEIELDDPNVPHILVVAVVTMPFTFEGRRRREQAEKGIADLRKHVDSILIINNDKLRELGNMQLSQAFKQADNVLLTAVKGIAEIITVSDYINIDFHDVNTVMQNSGTALMGTGMGKGDDRAMNAIQEASRSVLLNDNDIAGAKNVLLYFSYPPNKELTMDEMENVTDFLTQLTGRDMADVIWGAGTDDKLDEELKITLIATGFEAKNEQKPKKFVLPNENIEQTKAATQLPQTSAGTATMNTAIKDDDSGMTIIHRESPNTETAQNSFEAVAAEVHTSIEEPVSHHYTLDGDLIDNGKTTEAGCEMANGKAHANGEVYADGINMVHHDTINSVSSQTTPSQGSMPTAAPAINSVVHAAQPIMQSPATPIDNADKPYVAPAVTPMEKPAAAPQNESNTNIPLQAAPTTPFYGSQQGAVFMRAERLNRAKHMNELLHKDPNGPSKVDEMTTEELTNEEIYHAPHSSESDATKSTMNSDGSINLRSPFVFDQPD
jgi:cell division protein FtsZ